MLQGILTVPAQPGREENSDTPGYESYEMKFQKVMIQYESQGKS